MKKIAKKLASMIEDNTMKSGTVVTFVAAGKYTYCAVFVADKWYLTGVAGFYSRTYSNTEFMAVLAAEDVSKVRVAVDWAKVKSG